MRPGCHGVQPDASAQQIQQFGRRQCGMVLSRTAELRQEAKPLQCSRGHERSLLFSSDSDLRRCLSLQKPFRKLRCKSQVHKLAQYTALGCFSKLCRILAMCFDAYSNPLAPSASSSRLLTALESVQECCACPWAPVSMHDTM